MPPNSVGEPPALRDPHAEQASPAAKLAHDFNNFLLAMTACLELIHNRSSEPRIAEFAAHGLDTALRGKELVARMVEMAGGNTAGSGPPSKSVAPTGHGTILVIDDDVDVRLVLVELLQSLGYGTVEASDGPAGIAALDRDPRPDLAIVDYALPGLNGIQVAAGLLDRRPKLPILIATGYGDSEVQDPGLGQLPILHKPFRIAELASAVATLFGNVPA